jgi:hypothetical protein
LKRSFRFQREHEGLIRQRVIRMDPEFAFADVDIRDAKQLVGEECLVDLDLCEHRLRIHSLRHRYLHPRDDHSEH